MKSVEGSAKNSIILYGGQLILYFSNKTKKRLHLVEVDDPPGQFRFEKAKIVNLKKHTHTHHGNEAGSEDSSGDGNGDEDNGNENEDRVWEGGREAEKREKPQNSCRRHVANGGDLGGKRNTCRKERVGPVTAKPGNLDSNEEVRGSTRYSGLK